jgi:hypothetical protein
VALGMRTCVLSIYQAHLALVHTVPVARSLCDLRGSSRLHVDQKPRYRFGGPSERRLRLAVSCAAAPFAAPQVSIGASLLMQPTLPHAMHHQRQ